MSTDDDNTDDNTNTRRIIHDYIGSLAFMPMSQKLERLSLYVQQDVCLGQFN